MPPRAIHTEAELEALLAEPTAAVVETMARLSGDLIVLGVAGKMGPSLARLARRASEAAGVRRRVIGVSRFSSAAVQTELERHGIETICCDLLNADEVAHLPEAANVVYLAGRKFGSIGNESLTWATNSYLPGIVCRKYRHSRIVALSTGNVYGPVPVAIGGSRETDPLDPVGEYAMSCLGRERVFEYFSRTSGIPVSLIRLNYACDLRYGVLVDLARQVWEEAPIDLDMGYFNTIWQGDANAWVLQALDHAAVPPWVVNVTGPELLSVRRVCERFGERMGKSVHFLGTESATALLSNAARALDCFGPLRVNAERLIDWTADWVIQGGRSLGKPTHFAVRDGKF